MCELPRRVDLHPAIATYAAGLKRPARGPGLVPSRRRGILRPWKVHPTNVRPELYVALSTPRSATKVEELSSVRKTWADLVAAARQNRMFISEGSRLTPLSELHVRVLRVVGYQDEQFFPSTSTTNQAGIQFPRVIVSSSKRIKLDQPSTSTGGPTGGGCNLETPRLSVSSIFPPATPSIASSTGSSAATTSSAAKSSKFFNILNGSLDRFVDRLADLLNSSFEEQNVLMRQKLRENN
ncbi:uncharacterized protein LOC116416687 [Nasonia vitripennis]|uniref:Uncharacterized protein n=1 Tax=Nasonia vitripennis TaxID=7425 RepID=A0A7M7Q523_NASVI|nr:uncharacterized protein LOC116416687 [Nasonia vitripennis]